MADPRTYTIATLDDILKVPAEVRAALFRDLETALLMHELAYGEQAQAVAISSLSWMDDGDRSVSLETTDEKQVAQLRVQIDETSAKAQAARAEKAELWEQLRASIASLQNERDRAERRAIMFGDVIENHTHAMQAAVIERYAGAGAESAMDWILNTLAGPGHMPDLDAATALPDAKTKGPAQAWFDMQEARHAAFRAANPGPAAQRKEKPHG